MLSIHPKIPDTKHPEAYAAGFEIFPWDDMELIAEMICRHVWSPIIWKDGVRKKANFLCVGYMTLDFDDGRPTLEEASKKYEDYAHIIATTKSHQKEKDGKPACDRFRLVVPFAEPVFDKTRYEYTMAVITKKTGADKSAKDGGRFFWPCKKIYEIKPNGMTAHTKDPPKYQEKKQEPWWRHPTKGPVKESTRFLLEHGVWNETERNPTIYIGAMDLLRHGWTPDEIYLALRPKTNLSDWRIKDAIYRSAVRDYKVLPFVKKA